MFKNRVLNITLAISLLWHIFWLSVVAIVTVPTGLRMADYSKIYFLGPVLEKRTVEFRDEKSPERDEGVYAQPLIPQYIFEVEVNKQDKALSPDAVSSQPAGSLPKDFLKETKTPAPYFFKKTE